MNHELEQAEIQIEQNSPKPLYQQVIDAFTQLIHSGQWPAGKKTPSENELVQQLQVSRMTINRALRELTQSGLLQRVQGVGTFVAEKAHHASLVEIRNIAEEIRSQGDRHSVTVIDFQVEHIDADLSSQMELKIDEEVFHVTLVHHRNDLPIQLEDRLVNPQVAPGFQDLDFHQTTPAEYLLTLIPAEEIEHIVQAILPDQEQCERLSIPATEPCLQLKRRTWSKGQIVSYVTFTYPSSRYDLSARYSTQEPTLLPNGFTPNTRERG